MRPSKHIDEQIRQKMENLETGYDPSSWDLLAHRMDYQAQQDIDHLLENRLGEIAVPLAADSWEAMQQMIEADEAAGVIENEARIDNIAHEKLHNLQVPYKDQHWALMAKRLEEEFSLRHLLYRYKIAEITLMALLILTIVRFLPSTEGDFSITPTAKQAPFLEHQRKEAPIIQSVKPQTTPDVPPKKDMIIGSPIASLQTDLSISKTKDNYFRPASAGSRNPVLPIVENGFITEVSAYNTTIERSDINPLEPTKTLASITAITASTRSRVEGITKKSIAQYKFVASKQQSDLVKVASLTLGPVNSTYEWELPAVKARPAKKHNDLRFGIFTTTDFNYVTTPPNQITVFGEAVKTDYNETMASGYGGGVNVSWKRDRWEYQTGGIYSFKRYIPNTPIFIFDTPNFFIKEDFNGIQLDIFQVPLNVLYHFKNTGKWHFYTSMGVSAHFVTATVYEIAHKSQALRANPGTSPDDDRKSITDEKESSLNFPSGLLDGGKLHGNFYLTANLGVGVERYLSPKWTVFFQPNYEHFFMSEGVGDNQDKIYTSSFYLGTKFNLK